MNNEGPFPWPADAPAVQVGDVRVDLRYRRLCLAEGEVELPRRVFDVLLVFLAEPHCLLTRESLLERIWSGVVVEDANLTQSVWTLRRLLGAARKDWIRTVPKSGYVFEPPGAVVAVDLATQPPSLSVQATAETASSTVCARSLPAPASRRRQRPYLLAAAIGLLGLSLAWLIVAAMPVSAAPRNIALIAVSDPGTPADARWPTTLLQAWIEWNLSITPEAVVLNAAEVSATSDTARDTELVMLVSQIDAQGRVSLEVRRAGHAARKLEGPLERVDAMVDELTRQLVADLLPQRAVAVRPPLRIGADAARHYAQSFDLRQARRWAAQVEQLNAVVASEPQFGLARLQLAQTLAMLGQMRAAEQQLDRLGEWSRQWPADATAILAAQRLALTQQHTQAADAYAQLAQRFPQQPVFALEQARAQVRAGLTADAIALLSTPVWDTRPIATRMSAYLIRANASTVMGDASNAGLAARQAERLAVGADWAYEHALAAQAIAMAEWLQHEGPSVSALFDEAANRFDASGDSLRGHWARFYAELADPARAPDELAALLAQARAAGHQGIEIDALRRVSFKHFRSGDFSAYRRYLDEAADVARDAGAVGALRAVEFDRINEDLLRGQFAGAYARAIELREGPSLGGLAPALGTFIAIATFRQGNLVATRNELERADPGGALVDRALRRQAPEAALHLACLRGALALTQGTPAMARTDFVRCATSTDPTINLFGRLGDAETALLSGDAIRARTMLADLRGQTDRFAHLPGRWSFVIDWAALATRSGDPHAAHSELASVLPAIRRAGYAMLEIDTLIGLAEAAMATADLAAARAHLIDARALAQADDWLARRRLLVVEALIAYADNNAGDAARFAAELDQQARTRGDVATELIAHDVYARIGQLGDCPATRQAELIARSGLRGASIAWTEAKAPAPHLVQAVR